MTPGGGLCRCGREIRDGLCSRCFTRPGQCTCVPFAAIVARMAPGSRLLDEPAVPPSLWGRGSQVLASSGEATMIVGPDGVGKTTLAGVLLRAQLGLGPGPAGQPREVLGYPVALLPPGKRVLYLAMDRPRQAKRSLARLFSPADRGALDGRLVLWEGPPPDDLAADPPLLAGMCRAAGAAVCYVDSLKDAALGISEDRTGAAWNRARQLAISGGTELFELHHPRKATGDNPKPRNLEDVYGSRWLTAGAGSVIFLWGKPGDAVVELYHRKQPAGEIPPLHMTIDAEHGTVSAEASADIASLIAASGLGAGAFTVHAAAQLMAGTLTPDRNQTEKARRQLKAMEAEGRAAVVDPGAQGRAGTWRLTGPPPQGANGHPVQAGQIPWHLLYKMADPGRVPG